MKNVVKKLFSLLLVGVVTVSMFSFVAPTNAEAAETDSYGTLIINQRGAYEAGFHATFYDFFGENLGEYDTGYLAKKNTREFKIPKNTYRVQVHVSIISIFFKGKCEKYIDFYADESVVNEKSRIELTSTNVTWDPKFDVKFNDGWSETAECPHRGIIQFNSVARCDYGSSFKATFYKDDQKLGEESLDLSNYPREAIKIPDYTNRIEATISGIKLSREIHDSATLKLDGSKACSTDVITINFGDWGLWGDYLPMEITCPNWWKNSNPSKRGSIQFTSYFNADNPNMYFKATFYGYGYQIGEKSVKLSNIGKYPEYNTVVDSETIKIPNGTTSIIVEVIKEGTPIDNATLEYLSAKGLEGDVTITLGDKWDGIWKAMRVNCPTNGWGRSKSTKKMSRGNIQLNSNFKADNPNMYLKATFYRGAFGYNQKIDETSVKLLTSDELLAQKRELPYGETIGIPSDTTSVKVEIIKEGKPIDSAAFELLRDKTFSEDAIKIDLGNYGSWEPMKFNYQECWQKIK